ncbi:MAG: restriction endonuclease subunit S [Kordiimonadaceae bacterium]|nr:restriction endonuclease subunit S [Kordiimonadaceae bacterium]
MWVKDSFENCIEKVGNTRKIPKKSFLLEGRFPIISQEKDHINGYWNLKEDVFHVTKPVVIFGDHTQTIKYIDFDFVKGADGVKILQPINDIDTKFFYYFIMANPIKSLGYARHYRLLKELMVPIPPLEEQKRIVAILDEVFEGIDQAIANTEKNIQNARDLFESYLNNIFTQKGEGWVESTFNDVCEKIQDGAHHSPKVLSSEKFEGSFLYITSKNIRTNHMILKNLQYTNAEFHNTIYPRCNAEFGDILLTKDGANTGNICLNELHEPISLLSSVCLIKTKQNVIRSQFLKYYIQSPNGFKQITGKMTGAAIKRIILRTIKAAVVPYPEINKQDEIIQKLDSILVKTQKLITNNQQKLTSLKELKQSLLQKAFAGELTSDMSEVA